MTIQLFDSKFNEIPIQFSTFPGGEEHVRISPIVDHTSYFTVQARLTNSSEVMRLLLLDNALEQMRISYNLHVPYFPYARQDRVCNPGEAFSLDVMGRLLFNNILPASVTIVDPHSSVIKRWCGEENIISQKEVICKWEGLCNFIKKGDVVLVAPDKGALHKTKEVAEEFDVPFIHAEKVRDPFTTKITHTEVNADIDSTKHYLILDDICDGGRTFIELTKVLRNKGATKVSLYVTHGIFSAGITPFEGLIDSIWTTNSFHPRYVSTYNNLNLYTFDVFSIL